MAPPDVIDHGQMTEEKSEAYRKQQYETRQVSGPQEFYRITSTNTDDQGKPLLDKNGHERGPGNPHGEWWVSEEQMAGFVDPETGQFDEERWRSWTAVKQEWQDSREGSLYVSEYALKEGETVTVDQGLTRHQTFSESNNVIHMGNAEQVRMHQVHKSRVNGPHLLDSSESKRMSRELAEKHPERVGKIRQGSQSATQGQRNRVVYPPKNDPRFKRWAQQSDFNKKTNRRGQTSRPAPRPKPRTKMTKKPSPSKKPKGPQR